MATKPSSSQLLMIVHDVDEDRRLSPTTEFDDEINSSENFPNTDHHHQTSRVHRNLENSASTMGNIQRFSTKKNR